MCDMQKLKSNKSIFFSFFLYPALDLALMVLGENSPFVAHMN